jgi:branched-chain amino acid transport system substrate-binding protein
MERIAMKQQKTLLCLAMMAGFAAASPALADDVVVKIGHVGPITGNIAHLGKDNENGARMAIDDLNAKHVMIGGKTAKFELVAEDDAADPKQGTAAATKLVDEKVNGVVGHLNSGTSIPASRIYAAAGIPEISPSATAVAYTANGYRSVFRVVANDGQLGGTLGKYAVDTLHGKSIAVVSDKTAYGDGVAEEFSKSAKAAGANIVDREFTTNNAVDFQTILTTIKGKSPDVIFYGGMDAQAGPFLRQMQQLGINAKLMGGDGICTAELAKLAGDSMKDGEVVCAEAGGVEAAQQKPLDDFKARYKTKFGTEVQIYAPYSYDAVMVMADAMEKAGSSDPAKYLPFLQKEDYKGVTGQIAFDAKGDIKNGSLTLHTYKGGEITTIGVVR